jgi:Family of unknown function (DUF5763)
MSNMKQCLGVVQTTGQRCTAGAKDINGFCHKHHKQSVEYARTHPWSVLVVKNRNRETYVKVDGLVSGAFCTSGQ